jgi:hypothetical protein
LTVILGEAALRQQAGGQDVPGQLRRIAGEPGTLPAPVTLQVVPFTAGAHAGIGTGPVSVMRFRDVAGIGVICHAGTGASIARQEDLTTEVRRFEALRAAALPPDESLEFIREMISTWR